MPPANFKSLAVAVARAADSKKGENIAVYHVGPSHPLADYLLIATALAPQHLDSLQTEIRKAAGDMGFKPLRSAGGDSKLWRVMDYGGLLVHLMTEQTRVFYGLDKLYAQSKQVKWESAASKALEAALPSGSARSAASAPKKPTRRKRK